MKNTSILNEIGFAHKITDVSVGFPFCTGRVNGKLFTAGTMRSSNGFQIWKVIPRESDKLSKGEMVAISHALVKNYHLNEKYPLRESNGENMKKRMSILEALSEIPDLGEGSYSDMHEDEESLDEAMYEEDSVEEGGCGSMYEEEADLKERFLNESRNWDKFTKDLIKRERNNLKERKEKRIDEKSPQREYNKRYREDWKNSTRWKK